MATACTTRNDGTTHIPWKMMRWSWPWGLLVPNVTRCLICGERIPARRRK